jgi:hypothetical protein
VAPVKTAGPGGRGKNARGAKTATGGGKKGGRGGRGGKKKPPRKKGKLKCGDSGKYGDLQKKYADGKERDHVPSCAALLQNAKNIRNGRKLCPAQESAIRRAAQACAIPKGVHAQYSETFRGRNTRNQIQSDANNKKKAANRDTAAINRGLKKSGASKDCQKKYAAWAETVNSRTQSWYEKMIRGAIAKGT